MVRYEIPSAEMRALFRKNTARVKMALATFANEEFGRRERRGIFKYEGGIVVNGREIAIHVGFVADDWRMDRNAETPEELATVCAIDRLVRRCTEDPTFLNGFDDDICGDPLRMLCSV